MRNQNPSNYYLSIYQGSFLSCIPSDRTNSNPSPTSDTFQCFAPPSWTVWTFVYLPYFPPILQGSTYICDYSEPLPDILVWRSILFWPILRNVLISFHFYWSFQCNGESVMTEKSWEVGWTNYLLCAVSGFKCISLSSEKTLPTLFLVFWTFLTRESGFWFPNARHSL